jgi:HSP20 family protein
MNCTVNRPRTRARVNYQPHLGNLINEFFNTAVGDVYQKAESKRTYTNPAVNVINYEDKTTLQLAVPGFSKDDVTITLDQDTLTIECQKEATDSTANYRLREFNYNGFKKAFKLPEDIDTANVKASFDLGILSIDLYKKEEAIPQPARQIDIV